MPYDNEEEEDANDEEDEVGVAIGEPEYIINRDSDDPDNEEELIFNQNMMSNQIDINHNYQVSQERHNPMIVEDSFVEPIAEITLEFDIILDYCFINLHQPVFNEDRQHIDKHKEILEIEKFQEKLGLFVQLIKLMTPDHAHLFKRLISEELNKAIIKLFIPSSQSCNHEPLAKVAIEIVEIISKFYLQNCSAKNVYEYPIQTFIKARDLILNGSQSVPPPPL